MRFLRRSPRDGSDRWIIVGLGNPGPRYANNRHNVGAMVVDELVRRGYGALKSHKSGTLLSERSLDGGSVVIARPTSYMNESGQQVAQLARWYKVPADRVIVVYDEIDLPFGDIRIKQGGGTAGHNGVRSIVRHLGSPDFVRVRTGVGRPSGRKEAAAHVLADFSAAERRELDGLISGAADAAERIVEVGAERAMNDVNTRSS
jgi:PTH1 family peptidyl-tRNA hydrolase